MGPFFCVSVSDGLPEVSDHNADSDPGLAAVCCATLPHCRGKEGHA